MSARKVIVIGGGVAGLSAAHELAHRGGFEVVVYEARDVAGGKARSMDAIPGTDGRAPLPGEHGFRFFPGFYRHLPDTMSRIPFGRRPHGVFDNLVTSTQMELAREDGLGEIVVPAHFPVTPAEWQAVLGFALELAVRAGMPLDDQAHFVRMLSDLMSACPERWFGQYENESWWVFSEAEQRSEAFRKLAADGLTRSLVAAQAREMSTRTGGSILLQLLRDLSTPGAKADRVLNGPTSEVWIDPWTAELRRLGVDIRLGAPVDAIASSGGRVTGVSGAGFDDAADFYVAAVPVEVLRERIEMDDLKRHSPVLAGLDRLVVRWMNGIMFYLGADVPLVHGHTIYIDSPWALTSISQRQFWPAIDLHGRGGGDVGGILSVDISDWNAPGAHTAKGRPARECAPAEVAEEVWEQLKAALNDGAEETLTDDNRVAWFLDPDIVAPNPPVEGMNLEPLLVNTVGSWAVRPEAELPQVENLFLASDYVRTHTDLATMEGANEAARRAVNAILDASGSDADRCGVWPLEAVGGLPFAAAREVDRVLYRAFGARRGPPATVTISGGAPKLNPLAALGR